MTQIKFGRSAEIYWLASEISRLLAPKTWPASALFSGVIIEWSGCRCSLEVLQPMRN